MRQEEPAPDRHNLERELNKTVARYQAILASTLDPIVTIDDQGVIQAASDSIERVFGWRPEELVGRNVSVLMPEPYRSRHDGYLARYRETGETRILGQARELEGARRDGTRFPVEVAIARVQAAGGDAPLFTGIIRDITARKTMESALQESERRFREILENVELVGVMLDTEGRITFCNDYLLRMTGWTRDEAIGRNWFEDFLPPGERERVEEVLRDAVERDAIVSSVENAIVTRGGELRLIAWTNTALRDAGGRLVGVTGLGLDVTDRQKAEEELRRHREQLAELVAERTSELDASHEQLRQADRLASIGTLAAGLGHDMNNVLLPIRARLDALDAGALPDEAREHFREVRRSAEYLQALADGLRLLSLDPDDSGVSTEGVDLDTWWDQVGPLLARGLPKHVRLATTLPTNLPALAVPPHRLTQAMLNLVVNAGEAVGSNGKVRIWAQVTRDHRFVRLGVTDNGFGMTPEVKRRALDPFFTTKTRGLGTGLGLSLVQGVARSAGGSIEIESTEGAGTTIVLSLPAQRAEPADAPDLNAMVTVGDQRRASLVTTLLLQSGFRLSDGDPDLWVTDASAPALATAEDFLAAGGRRIIVLGPAEALKPAAGVELVADPDDFETLRRTIHDAACTLAGEPSS